MSMDSKMSFKEIALNVLKSGDKPLSAQEIVDKAMQEGILATEGGRGDVGAESA